MIHLRPVLGGVKRIKQPISVSAPVQAIIKFSGMLAANGRPARFYQVPANDIIRPGRRPSTHTAASDRIGKPRGQS